MFNIVFKSFLRSTSEHVERALISCRDLYRLIVQLMYMFLTTPISGRCSLDCSTLVSRTSHSRDRFGLFRAEGSQPRCCDARSPGKPCRSSAACTIVRIVVFKRVACEWIFKFYRQVSFARRFSWEIIASVTSRRGSIGVFMLYPLICARMLLHINPVYYA